MTKRSRQKLRILDLFSGLGGASEAFVQAGDEVLRIENNPLLEATPHTHMMDVRELSAFLQEYAVGRDDYDVVWASPPCTEFSNAYGAPKAVAHREGREHNPSLDLLHTTLEIIDALDPRWWVIENVRGACPWFNPILGEPRQVIGSIVLWGRFPELRMPEGFVHRKGDEPPGSRHSPLRANIRAKIPLEVSKALRIAVMSQEVIV